MLVRNSLLCALTMIVNAGLAAAQGAPADPAPADPAPADPAPADPGGQPPVAAASASADKGTWSVAVAPRMGMTLPTSKLGLWALGGLEIDVATPVLSRRLVATVDLSYTRPGYSGSVSDPRVGGDATYEIDENEFKVSLGAAYRFFTADRRLIPWAGAGLVMHMLRSTETTSVAPGDNMSQDTRFGFELVGGADFGLGPGYLLGELRVTYSGLDHLLTGTSNAGNVMFGLGYRLVI